MACECGTKIRIIGNATVGDSILNPFDAEWLYALCKYNDWKCVHTDNGVDFTIDTTIEVGNCSIPTYFIDMGHNFTFGGAHGFTLCPPAYISTSGSQTWTMTEKGQIRDALGIDGDKNDSIGGVLQVIKDTQIIRQGTVLSIITATRFTTDLIETDDIYWNRAAIRWTSGANEGTIRKIQNYVGTTKEIALRTLSTSNIQLGDTFDIIPLRAFRLNYDDVTKIVNDVDTDLSTDHGAGSWETADTTAIETSLTDLQTDITYLKDEAIGKWEITSSNQMIFYTEAGIELTRYNLFDAAGTPTTANVTRRERV